MSSTSTRRAGNSGLKSYDAVQVRGDLPWVSHVHVDEGMSSLMQRCDSESGSRIEFTVTEATDFVLVSRLAGPCAVACRLQGSAQDFHAMRSSHVAIPVGVDSWWGVEPRAADGWFHLHFAPARLVQLQEEFGSFDRLQVFRDERLTGLVEMARSLTEGQRPPTLVWDSLAVLILHRLAQDQGRPELLLRHERLAPWQVRRVLDRLHADFRGELSLTVLAELVDLSPYHFARAFRNTVGLPPHRYQVGLRVDHARELLLRTDWTVLAVALEAGYESQASFSRAFRSVHGQTPQQYRRLHRSSS